MAPQLKVRWTAAAAEDLVAIAEYISRDSPSYASALIEELRMRSAVLGRFPGRGRVVPDTHDPAIRELLLGSYRLVYRRGADVIEILAVIHGARDFPAALARRPR